MTKKKRNWLEDGPPDWLWPCLVTSWALGERALALFNVGRSFDLVNSPSANWLTGLVATVLAGYLGNKWIKKSEERKANPKAAQSDQPPTG